MGPGPITSWYSAMGEPPRMSEAQSRRVKKLIRRLCANNDGGFCLLLDDGDPCVCPQSITNALVCRYFKTAVLPADLELNSEILGDTNLRRCTQCGGLFTPTGNRAVYCKICAEARDRERKAVWARKTRLMRRCLGPGNR